MTSKTSTIYWYWFIVIILIVEKCFGFFYLIKKAWIDSKRKLRNESRMNSGHNSLIYYWFMAKQTSKIEGMLLISVLLFGLPWMNEWCYYVVDLYIVENFEWPLLSPISLKETIKLDFGSWKKMCCEFVGTDFLPFRFMLFTHSRCSIT